MTKEIIPHDRGSLTTEIKILPSDTKTVTVSTKNTETPVPVAHKPAYTILDSGAGFIALDTPQGKQRRSAGTISWRNNNPGNLVYGPLTKKHNAIGKDYKGFAVFPDYDSGVAAYHDLLFSPDSSYYNLTVEEALYRYAPPSENNTKAYLNYVTRIAMLSRGQRLSKLTADQQKNLMNAMFKYEGWQEGTVTND